MVGLTCGALLMQDAKERKQLDKSAELRKLTELYGTKMAFLIFYLRNLFDDKKDSRVIIFSQVRHDPLAGVVIFPQVCRHFLAGASLSSRGASFCCRASCDVQLQ